MNYLFEFFLIVFSSFTGFIFGIFSSKLNSDRQLWDNRLTLVYTPLYREICFTNLGTKQSQVIETIKDVIYNNFQYVPDDLYDITMKLLKKSQCRDFNLWNSSEWLNFVDYVEKQYLWIQRNINFDKKAQNPDLKKYKNKLIAYFALMTICCMGYSIYFIIVELKLIKSLFNNPKYPELILSCIGLLFMFFVSFIYFTYNFSQRYSRYIRK